MNSNNIFKKIITFIILFVLIPLVIFFGVWAFKDRKYNLLSIIIVIFSCIPFFLHFEKSKKGIRELVIIAVMTAFSILGRFVFSPIPGFKPVTAITIIAGIALGAESGFMVGSLTAIISNIFFGQGPWTPFQMFVWGLLGFISGLIFYNKKNPNRFVLSLMGLIGGCIYSLLMDIWTTISIDGEFLISRYFVHVSSSVVFMLIYMISNVIFLLILAKPFTEKINRIKVKYGVFNASNYI